MPRDVFVMRAPQPEPPWEWDRWLRATETELAPTPLLLFVRDRFDAMEALLRQLVDEIDHNPDATYRLPSDLCDGARALLVEIDAAKERG